MVMLLIGLAVAMGPMWIVKLYVVPYLVSSQNQSMICVYRGRCVRGFRQTPIIIYTPLTITTSTAYVEAQRFHYM